MVNKAKEQDLAKIKRLIESALSPREKAMYEKLLDKAEKQIAKALSGTTTKVKPVSLPLSSPPKKQAVTEELPLEKKEASPLLETKEAMFQAIGVIEGEISVNENSQLRITLGNRKYRLGYTGKSRKRDYARLLEEISSQGSKVEKISVYPQVNYKSKSKHGGENSSYEISFNLVSVEKPSVKENQKIAGIFGDLAVGEFQISGYWQYVA